MPRDLQKRIRDRAKERDEEGSYVNPSLEELHEAARGTPLQKRRKKGKRIVQTPPGRTRHGGNVSSALAKAARSRAPAGAAEPDEDPGSPDNDASPVVLMLHDMGRVLEVFRSEEGRDPTSDDKEFWIAYKKIIAERIGA